LVDFKYTRLALPFYIRFGEGIVYKMINKTKNMTHPETNLRGEFLY